MTLRILAAIVITMIWASIGCGENDSKMAVAFTGSDCKSHLFLPQAGPSALYTMEQSLPYQGLQCVSFKHDENNLFSIDLINFHGACGAEYVGDYTAGENGELNLLVNNPGCRIAACGYCVYDWSFEVENVETAELTINVVENPCPESDQSPSETSFQITKSELETGQGISCTYKDISLFETIACGTLHQPCNQLASDSSDNDPLCGVADTQCDTGYTCTQTDAMPQPICVAECTENADCPLQPLLTCDNGLCLLKWIE
ncbi:MAG: hypothetical protein JXX14_05310 [Deltaproteobacteria bacterium]|nr:hypothetical protein [Deltaproteobacteria bacterium]